MLLSSSHALSLALVRSRSLSLDCVSSPRLSRILHKNTFKLDLIACEVATNSLRWKWWLSSSFSPLYLAQSKCERQCRRLPGKASLNEQENWKVLIHGIKGFLIPTKSFVKIGITKIFCYNNKMFSSINKTFVYNSKILGCSNEKFICCP